VSYFPQPYSPPPDFSMPAWPPAEALWPARRAAVLMFVLCGLLLGGALVFFLAAMIPIDQYPPEQREKIEQVVSPTGKTVKEYCLTGAYLLGAMGVVLGGLGFWVRSGRLAAIITAMVIDGVMLLFAALSMLSVFVAPSGGGPLQALPLIGVGAIMTLLMARLITAGRAACQAKAMADQYQAQYWQQLPETGELGYGQPLPPPPDDQPKTQG
jgi:hypothetical protein